MHIPSLASSTARFHRLWVYSAKLTLHKEVVVQLCVVREELSIQLAVLHLSVVLQAYLPLIPVSSKAEVWDRTSGSCLVLEAAAGEPGDQKEPAAPPVLPPPCVGGVWLGRLFKLYMLTC